MSLLLLVGAYTDIRERRLANWLSLALLVFGLAHGFAQGGLPEMGWHGAHAAIALLVGMALFAGGIIGGGDAKFYTGMAAYFPLAMGLKLVMWVTLLGGALVLVWILQRRLRGIPLKRDGDHGKFPYGVAIAVGGLALAWPMLGLA
ncbi:MAG: A24 family peptidase [Erythrobacter sp.]